MKLNSHYRKTQTPEKRKEERIRSREWNRKNYEHIRQRTKARRLRLRFEIFKRDKFICQYCGRKVPDIILEIDHIMPKSKGGLNEINNYKTACKECNKGKGDKILEEFNK